MVCRSRISAGIFRSLIFFLGKLIPVLPALAVVTSLREQTLWLKDGE
jgi:hypothetical protein